MKRSVQSRSLSRLAAVRSMSVCYTAKNAAQKLYALRFYFFVFFFTRSPIRLNCS